MKASTLLVTIALAVTASGCDSTVPADESRLSAQRGEASPARPMTATPMVAARASGNVAELSGGAAGVATDAMSAESPPSQTTADPLQHMSAGSVAPTMVIRTGQAFIEVEKVDVAALKVRQLSAQVGGFITNSSISGGRDQIRQATFELKIPASKYDQAADMLSTIGKVETVTSTAQDVGEEFVDVTARVTNSRRLEERLISLLANRTGKLDEVLRVERELARVREEIERYEGRLRYLSARVALSTLTITIHEPAPILGNSPGENPIAAALRRAWKNFIAVVAGSIAALGVVIPLVLLGLAAWLGYRRWKRR
jgi:type IV secretory pathway VirB2 component (pilin)